MLRAGIRPAMAGIQNHHHIGEVLGYALFASETLRFKQCRLIAFTVGIALRQVAVGQIFKRNVYPLTCVDVPHIGDAAPPRDEFTGLNNVLVVLKVRKARDHGTVKGFTFFQRIERIFALAIGTVTKAVVQLGQFGLRRKNPGKLGQGLRLGNPGKLGQGLCLDDALGRRPRHSLAEQRARNKDPLSCPETRLDTSVLRMLNNLLVRLAVSHDPRAD